MNTHRLLPRGLLERQHQITHSFVSVPTHGNYAAPWHSVKTGVMLTCSSTVHVSCITVSLFLISSLIYFRFFIGTSVSTFSFRIHEEREILGFDPKATYNRFCGDTEKDCEQPTHWKIVFWCVELLSWHTQVPNTVLKVTYICMGYTTYLNCFMVYFFTFWGVRVVQSTSLNLKTATFNEVFLGLNVDPSWQPGVLQNIFIISTMMRKCCIMTAVKKCCIPVFSF